MKSEDFISIVSIQIQDGEKEKTELMTSAEITHEGDIYRISYEDTEATGFEGSETIIEVRGNNEAVIMRKGTANALMSLETGNRHYCQYGTPFGSMQLGLYTHVIENNLEKDGKLYMKYTIDLNASHLSDNEIIITVNKKG
ncbi:MAG: DUF1934 domain-containing protein [Ruminococcus sp.]|nr:DUF1934 domain-containing protein [Ruminococcus sp.]